MSAGAVSAWAAACRSASRSTLDTFLIARMAEGHIPGLAAVVVKREGALWSKGYGFADLENRIPMSALTVMNVGSVSKTVTSTAVMQLWEANQVRLDDDVGDYLPFAVRNPRHPRASITFRQLLTHRSSITDGPSYARSYACGDPRVSLAEWIAGYFTPGGPYHDGVANFHQWAPGETDPPPQPRAYSNVGYGLLGYLVEQIAGMSFALYCRQHVLGPLGMAATGWYISDINRADHAVPYTFVTDDLSALEQSPLPSYLPRFDPRDRPPVSRSYFPHCLYSFPNYPDGLLRTSVDALSRFLLAYINDGTWEGVRVLQPDTVHTMLSDRHFGRGLCWGKRTLDNGEVMWGHGGGTPAFRPTWGSDPATEWGSSFSSTVAIPETRGRSSLSD